MKIVFFPTSVIAKSSVPILSDEAQKKVQEGHDVYFIHCGRFFNMCASNSKGNAGLCKVCQLWTKKALSYLDKRIHVMTLNDFDIDDQPLIWNYNNAKELRNIKYGDAQLGMAALSTYINFTRNLSPKIDERSKPYFDNMLEQGRKLADVFKKIDEAISPDLYYLFNGRRIDTRPAFDVLEGLNKNVKLMELFCTTDSLLYKEVYDNVMPHDIDNNEKRIDEIWDSADLSEIEKKKIGKMFYDNRRGGLAAGDKVYSGSQVSGLLPENWDSRKHNVVIFNSSEDEFAAVGGRYDDIMIYNTQLDGIVDILSKFSDNHNYYFYIRVHPNLASITYKYHTDLYKLEKTFKNVTVIPANSKISSYSLMDVADKVVVFGSTMGIESAYNHKPVICLSGCYYYDMDISYNPCSREELYDLIKNNITPKFNDNIYKYGFYYTYSRGRTMDMNRYTHFDYKGFELNVLGLKTHGVEYQKILGSSKLFIMLISIYRVIASKTHRNKFVIPTEEA